MGISNIHLRLEDQQESVITEHKSYEDGSRAYEDSDLREPPQPRSGESIIADKVCIGVTLKELTLRTTDSTVDAAAEGAGEETGRFDSISSSSDSAEEDNPTIDGTEASKLDQRERQASGSDILTATEDKAGLVIKKAASQGTSSFFFDRTVKENRGVPLLREFSIKGFAIYINSGPETHLISFSSAQSVD